MRAWAWWLVIGGAVTIAVLGCAVYQSSLPYHHYRSLGLFETATFTAIVTIVQAHRSR